MDSAEKPLTEEGFLAMLGRRAAWERWPGGAGAGLLDAAIMQTEEYFSGRLLEFDLPLAFDGTPFQKSVWKELQRIPYGETRSYRDVAEAIGKPAAVRAVGAANGRNNLPVLVPCHRVIGADGRLTGFGGGIALKQALLAHEAEILKKRSSLFA